jgi:trehalose 6-phosphate phosphatase
MAVPATLAPICARPADSAIFLDFDGTLAPIVDDPDAARPLPGVAELLVELGASFGTVAVVSGRAAAFLGEHLGHPPRVRLIGLYGLEEVGRPSGPTVSAEALEEWRPRMEALARRAQAEAPPGISVEPKALAFTLHFRHAPKSARWVHGFADEARRKVGVLVQPGRLAVELRAGIEVDKGAVVYELAAGRTAVCCFGDDLGDLPAFAALGVLGEAGLAVARVAVVDEESPHEVADAADVIVSGPLGALTLLREMAGAVGY